MVVELWRDIFVKKKYLWRDIFVFPGLQLPPPRVLLLLAIHGATATCSPPRRLARGSLCGLDCWNGFHAEFQRDGPIHVTLAWVKRKQSTNLMDQAHLARILRETHSNDPVHEASPCESSRWQAGGGGAMDGQQKEQHAGRRQLELGKDGNIPPQIFFYGQKYPSTILLPLNVMIIEIDLNPMIK